jgi:hypothetical protein
MRTSFSKIPSVRKWLADKYGFGRHQKMSEQHKMHHYRRKAGSVRRKPRPMSQRDECNQHGGNEARKENEERLATGKDVPRPTKLLPL